MKYKKNIKLTNLLILVITFLFATSCENLDNKKESNSIEENAIEQNNNSESEGKNEPLEFTLDKLKLSYMPYSKSDRIKYVVNPYCKFKILNKKGIDFNNYSTCEGNIILRYSGETEFIKMYDSGCSPEFTIIEGKKGKWKNNTIRTFEFKGRKDHGNLLYYCGTNENYFERTPEEVYFTFKYHFIGVDGEESGLIKFDLMDDWIFYQEELGLR